MRNKKGDASTVNVVIWIIIAVVVLLLLIWVFNDKFKSFVYGAKCKGYCIEKQEECTTHVTHEDWYCKKETKGKWPYCCVDASYKGDPAAKFKEDGVSEGAEGSTGTAGQILITDLAGNVVNQALPMGVAVDEAETLKFSYPDDKDCVVYVLDKSVEPAAKLPVINAGQKSVRFNCKAGAAVSITIPEIYADRDLKLDMVVLKDSSADSTLQSNWLASAGISLTVLGEHEINELLLKIPSLFEQYYDHDFQRTYLLEYVAYDGDKSSLKCEYDFIPEPAGDWSMSVAEIQNCVYQITYDKTIKATHSDQIKFTILTYNNDKHAEKTVTFKVNYDAELYCYGKTGPESCDIAGCVWDEEFNACKPK